MSAVLAEPELILRNMQETDLTDVIAIETLAYPFPWTLNIFRDCLRVGYSSGVLTRDDEVVGYGLMSVGAGEAHILNLCVHPSYQRRGYGRCMLEFLLEMANQRGAEAIFLEVRPSNTAAHQLYLQAGFSQVGVRQNYYPAHQGREAALILTRSLT
jgi:ribosomal-protein-alanine N-acetyltransferase